MSQVVSMVLGPDGAEHVRLDIHLPVDEEGRARVNLAVHDGGLRAKARTSLTIDELLGFRSELRQLCDALSGTATLNALEGCLSVAVAMAPLGSAIVKGFATDDPARRDERSLSFAFGMDQSFLPKALAALDELPEASTSAG